MTINTFSTVNRKRIEDAKAVFFNDYFNNMISPERIKEVVDKTMNKTEASRVLEAESMVMFNRLGFKVAPTALMYDLLFGADMKIEFDDSSMFVDVTSYKFGRDIKYLNLSGRVMGAFDDAAIELSFGRIAVGYKLNHSSFFRYDKPVVVFVVELNNGTLQFTPFEKFILEGLFKAVNDKLVYDLGCTRQATSIIYPNPNYFDLSKVI